MCGAFADFFGYLLNIIYELVKNYGIAIILFSIILKILLLPLSINQQKAMVKSAKIQVKMKDVKAKYGDNPQKLNEETIKLYKEEKVNPLGGCLSGIVQIVVILAMFFLVSKPLTHMKKIDHDTLNGYINEIKADSSSDAGLYPEIGVIKKHSTDVNSEVYINMDFLGQDLSLVPKNNVSDIRVYIIPLLYVISSIISIRITTRMQTGKNNNTTENDKKDDTAEAIQQANKMMVYIMPVMAVSIAIIAPLGLALYWLVNNILMIVEKLLINKYLIDKEEVK